MVAGQIQASRIRAEWRRARATELYCRFRLHQQEIAEQLGVSQATIARDLKILVSRWREAAVGDIEAWLGRELADLDEMERDCAVQFQNTKDSRFMAERLQIKKRRAQMLGLDAPVRLAGADGGPIQLQAVPWDFTSLTDDEFDILEKITERHHGQEDGRPQLTS